MLNPDKMKSIRFSPKFVKFLFSTVLLLTGPCCGRNQRSQKVIERIGAVKEGVLRNHMILPDGHIRHSVFYSILDSEWHEVKKRLEEMLER